jgi:hypothetical protein
MNPTLRSHIWECVLTTLSQLCSQMDMDSVDLGTCLTSLTTLSDDSLSTTCGTQNKVDLLTNYVRMCLGKFQKESAPPVSTSCSNIPMHRLTFIASMTAPSVTGNVAVPQSWTVRRHTDVHSDDEMVNPVLSYTSSDEELTI